MPPSRRRVLWLDRIERRVPRALPKVVKLRLPRFAGDVLGLRKGSNNDSEEAGQGNAPAV